MNKPAFGGLVAKLWETERLCCKFEMLYHARIALRNNSIGYIAGGDK
jgi:hypothetical protein